MTRREFEALVDSALQLSYFTIAWNGVVGATALVVGLTIGSLALAAFALNANAVWGADAEKNWGYVSNCTPKGNIDISPAPRGALPSRMAAARPWDRSRATR